MSPAEAEDARFARQALLPGVGPAGQQLIRDSRIHVGGAGATAGPALLYLAQAGVGTIYLDDGGDVDGGDAGSWLYAPDQVGQQRLLVAIEALRAASSLVRFRPFSTDVEPTAILVCAQHESVARTAAERARLSGLPHVVALASGDGGVVVAIPSGAPCLGCASRPSARLPPRAGAASAIGTLAAVELLLVIARLLPGTAIGRRFDLAEGWPSVRPTERVAGCDCHVVH